MHIFVLFTYNTFSLALQKNLAFQETWVRIKNIPILIFYDGVFSFLETDAIYFVQCEEYSAFNIVFAPVFLVSCLEGLLCLRNFFYK